MHLFVDISSHGFGHFAITAPVLNAVAEMCPDLRLTVRSGLSAAKLAQRIRPPFAHIAAASDFGYVMHDALSVDLAATTDAYRAAHADWPAHVAAEANLLEHLRPDVVLSNVSYLPLAGATIAGIPALTICSLNWADLFAYFFGHEDWAAPIHAEMLDAYRAAEKFIRITPAMAMADLANTVTVGPVASLGQRRDLGLNGDKAVLMHWAALTTTCQWITGRACPVSAGWSPNTGNAAIPTPSPMSASAFRSPTCCVPPTPSSPSPATAPSPKPPAMAHPSFISAARTGQSRNA